MTSSYEQRIVDAMLRRAEALDAGNDQAAAAALVEAGDAVAAMRGNRAGISRRIMSRSEELAHGEANRRGEQPPLAGCMCDCCTQMRERDRDQRARREE